MSECDSNHDDAWNTLIANFHGFLLLIRIWDTMKKVCECVSLAVVILLVFHEVSYFRLRNSYVKGPMNPYVFFTDDVRLALEKASEDARAGRLSKEDAKVLLEKYDVRCCQLYKGAVRWTIPYRCLPLSVIYTYSPGKPYPDSGPSCETGIQYIGNDWYWELVR